MTVSKTDATPTLRQSPTPDPAGLSEGDCESDFGGSGGSPRSLVAVTVVLSEPLGAQPAVDWAASLGSLLRVAFKYTTVEIIDTWRMDQ